PAGAAEQECGSDHGGEQPANDHGRHCETHRSSYSCHHPRGDRGCTRPFVPSRRPDLANIGFGKARATAARTVSLRPAETALTPRVGPLKSATALSSRGQDGWFSAIKPGFESP